MFTLKVVTLLGEQLMNVQHESHSVFVPDIDDLIVINSKFYRVIQRHCTFSSPFGKLDAVSYAESGIPNSQYNTEVLLHCRPLPWIGHV